MNLLTEPWMPVRKRDGSREWVAPDRLSDPELLAFDADRADFNGALAQFAIGLLQTTTPMDSAIEWRELFNNPPKVDVLKTWYAPVTAAFEFDGGGARFMQDIELTSDGGIRCEIDALLIESPGEKSVKDNSDHFVKRADGVVFCPHCAAAALLTLQINAPAGGVGHRTGLRGGGPLTTLLLNPTDNGLWKDLWLNVTEVGSFLAGGGDDTRTEAWYSFPWLVSNSIFQNAGGEIAPVQVHPAHVLWAMPRRIRLDVSQAQSGTCHVCSRISDRPIGSYVTRNYGLNYKGAWNHPLSPYYEMKGEWLPIHPQAGGLGYRHWLPWIMGRSSAGRNQRPARVVEHFLRRRGTVSGALRLWAFGYDMENMKPRCWYESTLPVYALADCALDAQRQIESEASNWLAGAELAASYLRAAIKDAWFSRDARGDLGAVDAMFWKRTEAAFYELLKRRIDAARDGVAFDELPARESWFQRLARVALDLFDRELVGCGLIERQEPRRAANAFQKLKRNLYGPKMRLAVGLGDKRAVGMSGLRSNRAETR